MNKKYLPRNILFASLFLLGIIVSIVALVSINGSGAVLKEKVNLIASSYGSFDGVQFIQFFEGEIKETRNLFTYVLSGGIILSIIAFFLLSNNINKVFIDNKTTNIDNLIKQHSSMFPYILGFVVFMILGCIGISCSLQSTDVITTYGEYLANDMVKDFVTVEEFNVLHSGLALTQTLVTLFAIISIVVAIIGLIFSLKKLFKIIEIKRLERE